MNYGIRNRSLLKTIGKVWNDSVEKLKAAWNQIVEVYQLAKTFVNGVIANFKPIVQGIWEGIVSWLQGAINGEAGAGYDIGVLAFDVILTAFSAGTASGAKFLPKVMKWLERLKTDAKNMISGLLKEASSKTDEVAGLETKIARCKILGKGCFVAGTPVLMAGNNPFKTPAVACAMAVMPLVAPIQDIKPDDMVVSYHHSDRYLTASNDEGIYVPGWQSYDYLNITPETWQIGTFEIIQADGEKVEVEANRPKTWYYENKVKAIGDKTWFYMPEIGIHGEATLLSVRPTVINTTNFALNQSGQVDRPVITTFKRYAPVVYDYHFSDGAIIGATPEHPFFSMDRKVYIAAGELQVGEQVMTAGERVVKFIAAKLRDKGEPVYNFEVWREHNYFVSGKDGGEWLLVHNSYPNIIKLSDWLKNPLINGSKPKNFNNRGATIMTNSGYSVPINDFGFPDFTQWIKRKTNGEPYAFTFKQGELTGENAVDFKLINQKFGFGNTQDSHLSFFADYTWHHHEDGKTLMLIPKNLNNPANGGLPHTGGRAVIEHNLNVGQSDFSKIIVFPSPQF